ncbi:MAG: hypothetical protein IPJ65_02165 [Archangiaceae bacterium]|nr:hypothetical protein [Archangiaceae bacterium]
MKITDICLRDCVMRKMGAAKISCDSEAQTVCSENTTMFGGTHSGGKCAVAAWYESSGPNKVLWCNRKISPACRAKAVVHELAHLCGWNEGDGKGVPFDNGVVGKECQ